MTEPHLENPEVVGVAINEGLPDPETVLDRLTDRYREYQRLMSRRRNQSIRFPSRVVGISFIADQHIGNEGVDYERLITEARLIERTPNLYCIQVGDLIDNYIIGKLLNLRIGTSVSIPEEWAVAQYYLQLLGPKLLAVVGGNHDKWTTAVSGIDQLRQVLSHIRADVLYHSDELCVSMGVGDLVVPARIRHKWRFSSILNPTHGIERAFERDQTKPFLLGIGAHTHVSGLARQFNAGGKTGLAVICGSYKVYDDYAMTLGMTAPNNSTAVTVVFHPQHGMIGYDNLNAAVEYLERNSRD